MKCVATAALTGALLAANPSPSFAQSKGADGTVLTFYGLRELEQDPKVSDAEKVKAWAEFMDRARRQLEYAEKARQRWKDAAKYRLIESARRAEGDPKLGARQRVAQWEAVLEAYPGTEEARLAKGRAAHWRDAELADLVAAAEKVEAGGALKVDRIRAWLSVVAWAPETRPGRAARKRIDALQKQLFVEAESIDGIERLDDGIRLEAWQDVLQGDPTAAQRAKAEKRVRALGGS